MRAKGATSIRHGAPKNGDRMRALSLRGCTHSVRDGSYTDRAIEAVYDAGRAATLAERAGRTQTVLS